MANKYFHSLQTLRKAVKKLPKDMTEAFGVEARDYDGVKFSIVDNGEQVKEKVPYFSITLNQIKEEPTVLKPIELRLSKEQYETFIANKADTIEKDITLYTLTLCEALETIRGLFRELVHGDFGTDQKVIFKENDFCGLALPKFEYISEEDYKKQMIGDMDTLRANFKHI